MIALLLFLVFLLVVGIASAVVTYHILRYRDSNDISGAVLLVYYVLSGLVLVLTALSLDWSVIANDIANLFRA